MEGFAEDLGEICDALDLRGATIVGHSVSGLIGLTAAIAAPARFANLAMVCPSPCFLNLPSYSGGFERSDLEELLALMDKNYIGWAHHLAPLVTGKPGGSQLSEELLHSFCSTDPFTAKTFAEATFLSDHRDLLGGAVHPVPVLQSARNALPRSQLEVIEADGHCLHMSHPATVAHLIRDFVSDFAHATRLH